MTFTTGDRHFEQWRTGRRRIYTSIAEKAADVIAAEARRQGER